MANTKDLESSAISASKIKLSTSSKTFYVICYVVVAVVAIIYNGPAVKTKKEEIYREQLLI